MARQRVRPDDYQTVNIWSFCAEALVACQVKTHAKGMPLPSRDDVASAAVWVMAQLPGEVSKAMIEAYIAAEKEFHDSICAALEAFFRA